ncbi:MAG: class II fructose-bisphosphate aldolase [Bacillota bacterium]
MLVNLNKILPDAKNSGYAVGAFNVYSMETVEIVYEAAQEMKMPVIIAFGEKYSSSSDLYLIAEMVKELTNRNSLPVGLHLDHCASKELIIKAIQAGFTSVMYDGSDLSFEENMKNTAEIVEIAHAANVTVEAELGYIPMEDTGEGIHKEQLTKVDEAKRFVSETNCDALAVAVGTIHGNYSGEPKIYHDRLIKIAEEVDIPLVLHGGSGNTEKDLKKAISEGVSKINVNTAISNAAVKTVKEMANENKDYHFSEYMDSVKKPMREVVKDHMKMFANNNF